MRLVSYIVLFLIGCGCTESSENGPVITHINPLNGYSQVVAVEQGGMTTLHISGQVGTGPDFETQMRTALAGMQEQLAASGATLDDLVKITTFIVDYTPAQLDTFRRVREDIMGNTDMPASTLVGVEALGLPEWKIEIEGIAVVR
jgi:enamine deaminase RidA (YjgF/YER057c/UK114 family)